MKKDEFNGLKKKSAEELKKVLAEKRNELLKAIAELKAGTEKNLKKAKNLRLFIARVKTIMRSLELKELFKKEGGKKIE